MAFFSLHITSNEQEFSYTFSYKFFEKKYEIGLIKLDGTLKIDDIAKQQTDASLPFITKIKNNNIYIKCDLVDASYVNEKILHSLYRIKVDDTLEDYIIDIEPRNINYNKMYTEQPKRIKFELVDIDGNLIKFKNINLFADIHFREKK